MSTSPQTGSAPPATSAAVTHDVQQAASSRRLGLALAVIATAQLMVVLDATIVNVALPHIQEALHFSGTNLEWVVNAYALAFGGLLLLGGRSGDLLGRRRIFIFGILLFSFGSLFGGCATSQAWLLTARAVQGAGGAFAAPTSLSLIAVTFPEGRQRNRAMGVYAAVSIAGAAVGLIVGGLLTSYASWRWVFFVNVPIGLLVAFLAPRVLGESERRRGRFDLPGAITGSLGIAALVYGLSNAATTSNGISHWGDTKVIVSLVASVVLAALLGALVALAIAMVATDAVLTKAQAKRLAIIAQGGLPKGLRLAHALSDGDMVFAAATGRRPMADSLRELTEIGAVASDCLARAVARGVHAATSLPFARALPAWRDKFAS